jgi:hypothetical protein
MYDYDLTNKLVALIREGSLIMGLVTQLTD